MTGTATRTVRDCIMAAQALMGVVPELDDLAAAELVTARAMQFEQEAAELPPAHRVEPWRANRPGCFDPMFGWSCMDCPATAEDLADELAAHRGAEWHSMYPHGFNLDAEQLPATMRDKCGPAPGGRWNCYPKGCTRPLDDCPLRDDFTGPDPELVERITEALSRHEFEALRAALSALEAGPVPVPYDELSERTRRLRVEQLRGHVQFVLEQLQVGQRV